MELGLEGKIVLVTGSTQGIGKAVAETYLREGAKVILNGRNQKKLKQICTELMKKYSTEQVDYFCADVAEEQEIKQIYQYIKNKYEKLDILIPNVGTGKPNNSNPLEISEWERFAKVNLYSVVLIVQKFQDLLQRGKDANIVLISSIAAKEKIGAPYGYAAAKNALLSLSKYLSKDLSDKHIRVNCVIPGNIYFEGGRWEELLKENYESVMKNIRSNVPMKRFGKPEEIANAIVFLSSECSTFTTGASLIIDGGQLSCIE